MVSPQICELARPTVTTFFLCTDFFSCVKHSDYPYIALLVELEEEGPNNRAWVGNIGKVDFARRLGRCLWAQEFLQSVCVSAIPHSQPFCTTQLMEG